MKFIFLTSFIFFTFLNAKTEYSAEQRKLLSYFSQTELPKEIQLKKKTIELSGQAVPVLAEVMRSSKYPEDKKWLATFLMARILGKKSVPFIAKFTEHKNWMMRLAALKVLQKFNEKNYVLEYSKLLKDDSLIVRRQAVELITVLNLTKLAPNLWNMLYDNSNYQGSNGKRKRNPILGDVILAMGKLKFDKVKSPLLKMASSNKYNDLYPAINSSLEMLTGAKAPKADLDSKKIFWKKQMLADAKI